MVYVVKKKVNESINEDASLTGFPIISRIDWSKLQRLISKELNNYLGNYFEGLSVFDEEATFRDGKAMVPFQIDLTKGFFRGTFESSEDLKTIEVYINDKVPSTDLGKAVHYYDVATMLARYIKQNYIKGFDSLKKDEK